MKKGFTLIELLAVIVILAIIALIATPLVLKYINDSRLRAFEASIHNVDSAANHYVVTKKLKEETLGNPEIVDIKDLSLDDKNRLSGSVSIYNSDGKYSISYNNVTDGNYVIKGDNNNKKIFNISSTNQPILLANDDQVVIDSNKYYIYGIDDVRNFESLFKVVGGEIEFVKSSTGTYGTGTKINVKKDDRIVETYIVVIFGDVNGDSAVDGFDAIEADVTFNQHTQLETYKLMAVDVNRNGKFDQEDCELIRKVAMYSCSINQKTGRTNC